MPNLKYQVPGTKVVFNVDADNWDDLDAKVKDIKARYENKTKGQIVVGERERKGFSPAPGKKSGYEGKPVGYESDVMQGDVASDFTQSMLGAAPVPPAMPAGAAPESVDVGREDMPGRKAASKAIALRQVSSALGQPADTLDKSAAKPTPPPQGPVSPTPQAGSKFLASSAADKAAEPRYETALDALVAGRPAAYAAQQEEQSFYNRLARGESALPIRKPVEAALGVAEPLMKNIPGGPAAADVGGFVARTGANLVEGATSPAGLGAAAVAATGPIGAAIVGTGFGLKMLWDFASKAGPEAVADLLEGDFERAKKQSGPEATAALLGLVGAVAGTKVAGTKAIGDIKAGIADRANRAATQPVVAELLAQNEARAGAGAPPVQEPPVAPAGSPVGPGGAPPAPPGGPVAGPGPAMPPQAAPPPAMPPVEPRTTPGPVGAPEPAPAPVATAPELVGKPTQVLEIEPPGTTPPPEVPPGEAVLAQEAIRTPLDKILAQGKGKTVYPIEATSKFGKPFIVTGPPIGDPDDPDEHRVPIKFPSGITGTLPVADVIVTSRPKPPEPEPVQEVAEAEVQEPDFIEGEDEAAPEQQEPPEPEQPEGETIRPPEDVGPEPREDEEPVQPEEPPPADPTDVTPAGLRAHRKATFGTDRAFHPDGRVKPRAGDKVYLPQGGPLGDSQLTGEVVGSKGGFRVRVTGASGGVTTLTGKTFPLDQRWTVVGDNTDKAILDRQRKAREEKKWQAEREADDRRIAEDVAAARSVAKASGQQIITVRDGKASVPPGTRVYSHLKKVGGEVTEDGEAVRWDSYPDAALSLDEDPGTITVEKKGKAPAATPAQRIPLEKASENRYLTVPFPAFVGDQPVEVQSHGDSEGKFRVKLPNGVERNVHKTKISVAPETQNTHMPPKEHEFGPPVEAPEVSAPAYEGEERRWDDSTTAHVNGLLEKEREGTATDEELADLDEIVGKRERGQYRARPKSDEGQLELGADTETEEDGERYAGPERRAEPTEGPRERREHPDTTARIEKLLQKKKDKRASKEELEELVDLLGERAEAETRRADTHFTGLWNKDSFEKVRREKTYERFVALDLKAFKWFNDTYGMDAGDAAIQAAADIVKKCAITVGGSGFNIGGDEFVIAFKRPGQLALMELEEAKGLVNEAFEDAFLEIQTEDGKIHTFQGIPIKIFEGNDATTVLSKLKTAGRSSQQPWTEVVRAQGEGEDTVPGVPPEGVGGGDEEPEAETAPGDQRQPGLGLEPEGEPGPGPERDVEADLPPGAVMLRTLRDAIVELQAPPGTYHTGPMAPGERIRKAAAMWSTAKDLADVLKAKTGLEVTKDYSISRLYDAIELAINYLAATDKRFMGNRESLRELIHDLPTKTVRDVATDKFQQFSTPADYAAVVAKLAGITKDDVVLEPSVGLGSLSAAAHVYEPRELFGNELEENRAELIQHMGVGLSETFSVDAGIINSALAKELSGDRQPTVVLMNPPFSASAGLDKKAILTAGKHITAAFRTLRDGGRLVAIVGAGMSPLAPKYRAVFDEMKAIGGVLVANFDMTGAQKIYAKYGTSFPTRVLIWDKVKKPQDVGGIRERKCQTLKQLEDFAPTLPERVKIETEVPGGERDRSGERNAPQPASEREARPGSAARPGVPVRTPTDAVGPETGRGNAPGEQGSTGRGGAVPEHAPGSEARPGVEVAGAPGRRTGPRAGAPEARPGVAAQPEPGGSRGKPAGGVLRPPVLDVEPGAGPDARDLKVEQTAGTGESEELSTAVFERYTPSIKIKGLKPHPAKLVESAAMSAVKYPPVDYSPWISEGAMERGDISDAQFEAIALSGNAHQQILPSGERRGFLVGDGTGVGKARIIAGVIADNWRQGRKRAVWVTENWRLVEDIKKELAAIGMNPDNVMRLDKVASDGSVPKKDGILVVTYTTLAAESSGKKKKKKGDQPAETEAASQVKKVARIDQIKEWLGADFEGVIAYDESHNMANAIATSKGGRKKEPSKRALAGIGLARSLPKSRVVYASATAATEVSNLAYADRLGLWGEETAFPDKGKFVTSVASGGIAAMELVAQGMKAAGVYCARTLSFEGVEVQRLQHDLTDSQKEMWDKLASAWRLVSSKIDDALGLTAKDHANRISKWAKLNAYNQFWSTNQRFWNMVLTSIQMPTVLVDMERQLKEGHAVVVQLTLTGKAQLDRAKKEMEEEDDLESLDLTPRRSLMEYVEKSFPVHQMVEKTDEDGNVKMVYATDSKGDYIENPDAVAMREALLTELGQLPVPDGALDQLINHFGPDKVAEVTGRNARLVRGPDGKLREEKRGSTANASEAADFMADRKKILVFSEAGGTGASYHSSRNAKNQRRRYHYLLQPGWRADKAIQGLGRTHRSNQENAPVDILVSTEVPGHKRFVSTIARRMAQSGALTKGQRSAAGQGMFTESDNLESPLAAQALSALFGLVRGGELEGMSREDFQEATGLDITSTLDMPEMTQFLNRVLSMPLEGQKIVFDKLSSLLGHLIDVARQAGTLELGVEDIRADEVKEVRRSVVNIDKRSHAETVYYELISKKKREPLRFPGARGIERYVKNKASGRIHALYDNRTTTTDKQGTVHMKLLAQTPFGQAWEPVEDFYSWGGQIDGKRFDEVDLEKAMALWDEQSKLVPKFHESPLHIVSGALLPVWNRLGAGTPRIRRVKITDGGRILGRLIDAAELDEVLTNLGVGQSSREITPTEVIEKVLNGKWRAKLANGWWLRRSLITGVERIEIDDNDQKAAQKLWDARLQVEKMGVLVERHSYTSRYLFPADEALEPVLARFMSTYPVVSLVPPAGKAGLASRGGSTRDAGDFAAGRRLIEKGPKPKKERPDPLPKVKEHPIRETFSELFSDMRNAFAPQTATLEATLAGDSMRETTARREHRLLQAHTMLKAAKIELDRKSESEVVTFLDKIERGDPQETPVLNEAAELVREILDEARDAIRNLGTGRLKHFFEDYFPHLWADTKKAEDWSATFTKQRNWEGSKTFLKKRHIEFIVDGLKPESEGGPGLKLKHPNPIDAVLDHLHNVYKYVACHQWLAEGRRHGYVKAFSVETMPSPPPGWERLDPRVGTIYGPGNIKLDEVVDQKLWDGATKILADLGAKHYRLPGTGRTHGVAYPTRGIILTRFASPLGLLWHEIGHLLDQKYDLWDELMKGAPGIEDELKRMAEDRIKTEDKISKSRKKYVMSRPELVANLLDGYVTNKEHYRKIAPKAFERLEAFLKKNDETAPILDLKPTITRKTITTKQDLHGLLVKGYWAAPKPVARIVNRALSPGLGHKKSYRGVRWVFNLLNQAQLGLSGFHWMFTVLDSLTSRGAVGIYQLAQGDVRQGLKNMAFGLSPHTPIQNVYRGHQIMQEALAGSASIPEVEWVITAGGRFKQESLYMTKAGEALGRALRQKSVLGVFGNLLPAFFEKTGAWLMEWWVPRMKLGVFAMLARYEVERLGPDVDPYVLRHALARAWDAVDDRMGQMVYDNLFWNRTAKDVAMLAVRSLGWNTGDIRHLGGAVTDLFTVGRRVGKPPAGGPPRGGKGGEGGPEEPPAPRYDLRDPVMTHRMAYGLYLAWGMGVIGAMTYYMLHKKAPKELNDLYAVPTGAKNTDGTDERFMYATYVKDVLAWSTHPLTTITHKLHPVLGDIYYIGRNADFWNIQIHDPKDPFFQQRLDDAKFLMREFLPFSVRQMIEGAPNPNTKLPAWAPMIGVTRAPSYVTGTPLTEAMKKYSAEHMPQGAKTREQGDRSKFLAQADDRLRGAKTPAEREAILSEVRQKEDEGELHPKDTKKVEKAGGMTSLQAAYSRSMPIEIALDFWDLASRSEREEIKPILHEKAYGKRASDGSSRPALWRKTRSGKDVEKIEARLKAIFGNE